MTQQDAASIDSHDIAQVNKAILEVACEAYYDGRPRIFLPREGINGLHPILDNVSMETICASASDLSDDGYVRTHDFRVSYPADGGEPLIMLGPRPSISITPLGVSYWKSISSARE